MATVLVLNTPVSVSLPNLPIFDMARVRFNSTVTLQEGLGKTDIQELRVRTLLSVMPMFEID